MKILCCAENIVLQKAKKAVPHNSLCAAAAKMAAIPGAGSPPSWRQQRKVSYAVLPNIISECFYWI
jgi:hypothetical protein